MPSSLSESEFPAAYSAADRTSLEGQKKFLTATRIRLAAVLAASIFGALLSVEDLSRLAAVLAAGAFGIALVAELYLLRVRPDRSWYDGRAAAESAKTLTWRFVVGGRPFGKEEMSDSEAEALLLERLREVIAGLKSIPMVTAVPGADQLTSAMRGVRSLSLTERKHEYLAGRIEDQRGWYLSKAGNNEKLAKGWMIALSLLEGGAVVGAVLLASGTLSFDLLGVAATAVAGGTAWTQTKQYQTLASAYAVASLELADIGSRGPSVQTEEEWADFVEHSEEAISREHTTWRASRG